MLSTTEEEKTSPPPDTEIDGSEIITNPRNGCGITGVEIAPSSRSYCGWCDCVIEEGCPRICRQYPYQKSTRVEYMHPSCAFHYDDGSWQKEKNGFVAPGKIHICHAHARGCTTPFSVEKGAAIISMFSGKPPCERFLVSSTGCQPLHYCFSCVTKFVSHEPHAKLLEKHIGAKQMTAPVAWRNAGNLFTGLQRCWGMPPLPKDETQREEFLGVFRIGGGDPEDCAMKNHETLRSKIEQAVKLGQRRPVSGGEFSGKKRGRDD